jgi:transcription elongation GreA/GreB family factor
MDKQFLVDQLAERLRESMAVARQAQKAASEEAREGATPAEKREDARVSQENSMLARGQARRADALIAELQALVGFRPPRLPPKSPIAVGAIVEVEDEDGALGRTFFLAPAGAGVELSGPGGDGFLSVVTPVSPIGKAVLGRRVGDSVEVVVQGQAREWTITFVE